MCVHMKDSITVESCGTEHWKQISQISVYKQTQHF